MISISALRSKAAWECFLAETQEFFPRVAAQYGYPGAAYSLADIGRAMQWLYHWLFPLAKQLPQADIAHIAMAGLCTLIATAMKLEYGTPLMLTEHGIYLRESYLAQAASLFGLFHKVFNLRFALRMTELQLPDCRHDFAVLRLQPALGVSAKAPGPNKFRRFIMAWTGQCLRRRTNLSPTQL